MKREYSVKFKLVIEASQHSANVLHFTTGSNRDEPGSRIPVVYFVGHEKKLRIISDVNGDHNHADATVINEDVVDVLIQQVLEENKYLYQIIINNLKVHEVENTQPQTYENVTMYVSDPWSYEQPGYLIGLQFSAGL